MNSKRIKKIIIFLIVIFIICFMIYKSGENTQYMNNLDYNINLLENGDMEITETWDMYINHTNTIFRDLNLYGYDNIEDISVVDLETGKELNQIDHEEYHVPTNSYYALPLQSTKFEIAWGTGMENSFGRKKYQIKYKISNVVNNYKDCQEWYWKLLEKGENAVPVQNVTGTITLPKPVEDIENLKVWGHGQVNGNVEKVSNNEVKFEVKNLSSGAMLELRTVTTEKIFNITDEEKASIEKLNSIITEETKWAEETNKTAEQTRILLIVVLVIYVILVIRFVLKIIKYVKINKRDNDGLIKKELKYYRDIPRENDATPNEATYLYNYNKKSLSNSSVQANMVSATILDLALKKVIELNEKNENIVVKILNQNPQDLKLDENEIFELLKDVGKNKEEFEIKELNQYAKKKYYKYSTNINNCVNYARNNLYKINLINKKEEKEYAGCEMASLKFKMLSLTYICAFIASVIFHVPILKGAVAYNFGISFQMNFIIYVLALLPLVSVAIITWKLQEKIREKIAVLTQSGMDEKIEWRALAKYMEDFSMLDEKEVPALSIWEKYLVYATAFGIAEKVIEQMKAKYPQVFIEENWDEQKMHDKYPIINFLSNPMYITYSNFRPVTSLKANVKMAYTTSMAEIAAHSSSSGSGGGGGFSSGGGRRRRPEAGMGGR